MISASDLRAGMTFVQDGKLIKVLDASHHKPGKGNTAILYVRILYYENSMDRYSDPNLP
jgi:translation elongation factor P/translation initiation factor 5A